MLEFLKVKNPDQIKSLLKTYDPLKDTWIVSDLKSKQEIQTEVLKKHSFYTDDAILRASDFWRLWIRRIEPTLQVVSSDFIKSLAQNFVDIHGKKLEIIDSEVSTLNKAVQEFASILLHPASEDILEEWLVAESVQQTAEKKWHRWYQLSKICLKYIVYDQKALDAKWSAAYLQTLDLKLLSWKRKLYVELGSELSSVEMGLFKHISLTQDVMIITPDPEWKEKFPYLLNTYKDNFGYGVPKDFSGTGDTGDLDSVTVPYTVKKEQFVRLSTQLAEIKFAVSKIRSWADKGISLDNVAIISADIEKYWPALQYYLAVEGLAFKKDSVAQVNSLSGVQNLLAELKNVSPDVAWDSLEKSFFSAEAATTNNLGFKFEKFKALFYQLYDEDDLNRDQKIKELFYKKVDFNSTLDRDDFLSYLVKVWMKRPQNNNELFEIIFKDLLAQSINIRMKFSRWVIFLKNRLSHKEIIAKKGLADGLAILPLMSAQMIAASHRIYIGLNDEAYHKKQSSLMSLKDSVSLKMQFDLAVECADESYLDFNLRWQSSSGAENFIYTSPHLGFISEPLSASLFFIENSPVSELMDPELTRTDELQMRLAQELSNFEGAPPVVALGAPPVSVERLRQDVSGYQAVVTSEVFRSLSVTDTENYAQCSFKLLAAKGFRLRDLPQVALDLDPRQKGSLVHQLFEFCIQLLSHNEYQIEKVADFLELKRTEFKIFPQQEGHWKIQKNKFLQLAQKFYQFEVSRVKIFSVETEKVIEIYFDLDLKIFTLNKPENYFTFNMRLDRVDTHKIKKYSVVYDYKSSAYQVANHSSWLTEQQFQMLLYIMALELINTKEDQNDNAASKSVVGALYYQYKTFDLKKGLIDETAALSDFALTKRNKSLINEDKKQELKEKFTAQMAEILTRLGAGEFNTQPSDLEICKKCDWRKLCRAPHLM